MRKKYQLEVNVCGCRLLMPAEPIPAKQAFEFRDQYVSLMMDAGHIIQQRGAALTPTTRFAAWWPDGQSPLMGEVISEFRLIEVQP